MEDKKRAIKVSDLDELAEGFQESRGITDKLTIKQMIAFAKEPVGGGENKLNQLFTKTITEVTAKDLEGVTAIGANAFEECRNLESIDLNDVATIGRYAFRNCRNLKSIDLEGVTTIREYAFNDCRSLKEVTIPEGMQSIGKSAFESCTEMETFTLPNTPVELGDTMLYKCWSLQELRIPEGYTKIPNSLTYGGVGYTNKTGVFNLYVPSTITYVGYSQFGVTVNPDSEQMPPTGSRCDVNVYFATQEAATVWFCSNTNEKGKQQGTLRMYVNGEPLTSITVPSSLKKLYNSMFIADLGGIDVVCEGNITDVYSKFGMGVKTISFLNNTTVPKANYYVDFFDVNILEEIRVPAALYDTWISTTNWSIWADYIVAV